MLRLARKFGRQPVDQALNREILELGDRPDRSCAEVDRIAIERFGIAGEVLMERAGTAAFALLRARWPQASTSEFAVLEFSFELCGSGAGGSFRRLTPGYSRDGLVDPAALLSSSRLQTQLTIQRS